MGTRQVKRQFNDGEKTEYDFDYRLRSVKTKRRPRRDLQLETTTQYVNNQVFSTQDAYGRREYLGYRVSDGQLIRRVQATKSSYTLANNAAVLNLVRAAAG